MSSTSAPNAHHEPLDGLPPFNQNVTLKYTESPNPGFSYGQTVKETEAGKKWLEGEKAGWKFVDPATEDPRELYKLLLSGIVPRPVALVSSVSESGAENLAPFSYFNMLNSGPPLIMFSSGVATKDTVANIKATKNFTASIISLPWVENANITCIDSPIGVEEWPISGLTKEPSTYVKAPRIRESAFTLECDLWQATDISNPVTGKHSLTIIIGLIKAVHVRNDVLNDRGTVDPAKLQPIARLGDISYVRLGDAFRLTRPVWEEEEGNIKAVLEARLPKGDE